MNKKERDAMVRGMFAESWFRETPVLELDTSTLSHNEWLALRGGLIAIGGSDIGTLLGVSEYKPAKQLFYEKLGVLEASFTDTKYTFMGKYMEESIGRLWTHWEDDWKKTMYNYDKGKTTRGYIARGMLINPECPAIVANLDGHIVKHPNRGEGVLEIKKMTGRSRNKYEGRIAPGHILQLQAYQLVTGAEYGELAILEDALDLDVYTLQSNTQIQDVIQEKSTSFVDSIHLGLEVLKNATTSHEIVQELSLLEPDDEDGELLSKFFTDKRRALEIDKKMCVAPESFAKLVIDRQTRDRDAAALMKERAVLDSKIKRWMTDELVTKATLDEGYVTFNDRLYFHPSIKKKLL